MSSSPAKTGAHSTVGSTTQQTPQHSTSLLPLNSYFYLCPRVSGERTPCVFASVKPERALPPLELELRTAASTCAGRATTPAPFSFFQDKFRCVDPTGLGSGELPWPCLPSDGTAGTSHSLSCSCVCTRTLEADISYHDCFPHQHTESLT